MGATGPRSQQEHLTYQKLRHFSYIDPSVPNLNQARLQTLKRRHAAFEMC